MRNSYIKRRTWANCLGTILKTYATKNAYLVAILIPIMTDCLIAVDPTVTSLIASIASVIGVILGAKIHQSIGAKNGSN